MAKPDDADQKKQEAALKKLGDQAKKVSKANSQAKKKMEAAMKNLKVK